MKKATATKKQPVRALVELYGEVPCTRPEFEEACAAGAIDASWLVKVGRHRKLKADHFDVAVESVRAWKEAASAPREPVFPDGVDVDDESTWPQDRDVLEAIKCHHAARCAKLKADHESGQYTHNDVVKRDCFAASRTARDHLLALPDRLCHDLAAEADSAVIRERLYGQIERTLTDFSKALLKIGGSSEKARKTDG